MRYPSCLVPTYLLFSFLSINLVFGSMTDSLYAEIEWYKNQKESKNPWPEDTVLYQNMISLAVTLENSSPDSALFWRNKVSDQILLALNQENIANCPRHILLLSLNFRGIGIIHGRRGNREESSRYFHKSLEILENHVITDPSYAQKINIEKAKNLNNLSIIYRMESMYDLALDYNRQSRSIFLTLREQDYHDPNELLSLLALSYNNEGIIHRSLGDLDKASENYQKALGYFEELNHNAGLLRTLNNIGRIETENGNFSKALQFYEKSEAMLVEQNDKNGLALVYSNISEASYGLGDYGKALRYAQKSYDISLEINAPARREVALGWLAQSNHRLGHNNLAYSHLFELLNLKDSLRVEEVTARVQEMEAKYQNEKKAREIDVLSKSNEIQELKLQQNLQQIRLQKVTIVIVLISLLVLGLTLFLLYRQLKLNRKAHNLLQTQFQEIQQKNEEIHAQKDEIETQKHYIESQVIQITQQRDEMAVQKQLLQEYNDNITDSIRYAKSIQNALLPEYSLMEKLFFDYFIIDMPSDIVSGDFYWVHPIDDNRIVFALADCTGHGVPGAFMSMLGISGLNELIIKQKDYSPELILEQLRNNITTALHADASGHLHRDGMDMTLCVWHKKERIIEFAAAQGRLWLMSEDEEGNCQIERFKGDPFPVGIHKKAGAFSKHTIELKENAKAIYLLSDGFYDQLHAETGKRYSSVRLSKKLTEIGHKPLPEQQKILLDEFLKWKGSELQLDDVSMLGIKLHE